MSLWLIKPVAAQTSPLTDFYFRATSNAVHSRDLFEWPMATDLDAVLKLNLTAPAAAQVLIVIDEGGEVVGKYKGKQTLPAGTQELRLPKVFATDKVLGQRLLTAKLELAVKGYAVERREITFEVKGPPQPKAEITSIRLYSPQNANLTSTPSATPQFGVGQPFVIDLTFSVSGNPAKLQPRLIVLVSMVEDDAFTGYDLERQTYEDHYDMKTIPLDDDGGEGSRRVILRGATPHFFASPWQNHHAFKVYAALDFGAGERVVKSVDGDVFDYTPGDGRRDDDPQRRLISIARQSSWAVTLPELQKSPIPVQ